MTIKTLFSLNLSFQYLNQSFIQNLSKSILLAIKKKEKEGTFSENLSFQFLSQAFIHKLIKINTLDYYLKKYIYIS